MTNIRRSRENELSRILEIINAAAEAYRTIIPAHHWHEPYMPRDAVERELANGVSFWVYEESGTVLGVMGIQQSGDVDLIRHAYVLPQCQGQGIGGKLLADLRSRSGRRILIGTWAAADWAIKFYQRHGFSLVPADDAPALLRTYWTIPEEQIQSSVVLAESSRAGFGRRRSGNE